MDFLIAKGNYLLAVVLMMVGLWAMMAKNNLMKKILGMAIFQPAIILFYVSISTKRGATLPVAWAKLGPPQPEQYANPLPQVLMLTAIVVGVATLGVALALAQKLYRHYHTLEEDEILAREAGGRPDHE